VALGRGEEKTAFKSAKFVAVRVLLAVSLTVALVELLQELIPWAKPRFTLIPLAFALGYIQDYSEAWRWLWDSVLARFVPKGKQDGS
jgi:hypothetical protein